MCMTSRIPHTPGTHVAFPFQKTDSKGFSTEQLCISYPKYTYCYSFTDVSRGLVSNHPGFAMFTMHFNIALCAVILWPKISISNLQRTISC